MSRVRIALFGFGRFGQEHAEAIASSSRAELVGIAARTEKTCRKATRSFGVPATTDYRQLTAREDVDAVDIVLPTDLHESTAIEALRSGKHVLVEKPMALTVSQCDRILAEASSRSLTLCVNLELRASNLWGRVKRDIDKGVVGEPLHGAFDLWRFPFRRGSEEWRYTQERVGSWTHEEPVHYLDAALWFFDALGSPDQITCHAIGRNGASVELSDNTTQLLRWPGGQFFQISGSNSLFGYHQQLRIVGEEGSIAVAWDGSDESAEEGRQDYFVVRNGRRRRVPIRTRSTEPLDLKRNIDAFCARVLGRQADIATGEDGRRSIALVEAALLSARSGTSAKLSL